MSTLREAWLCVVRGADGNEDTELITIERDGCGAPPVIALTNGACITCTQPANVSKAGAESLAA